MEAANAAIATNLADNTIYGNDYNSMPVPFRESEGFLQIAEVSPRRSVRRLSTKPDG